MKAIRKIVKANKEILSLWLLLFFLAASTGRNVVSVFEPAHSSEAHYEKNGQYSVSAAVDDSILGTISLKDSDVDDIELIYYGDYTAQKQAVLPTEEQNIVQYTEQYSTYKIPLYDLYCNWKFHLS